MSASAGYPWQKIPTARGCSTLVEIVAKVLGRGQNEGGRKPDVEHVDGSLIEIFGEDIEVQS
jgi:hypothetical protein